MSTSREVTVWCDGDGCHAWTYGADAPHRTAATARRGARAEGWVHRDGRDLCPACGGGKPLPMTYPEGHPLHGATAVPAEEVQPNDTLGLPGQ